MLDLIVNLIGWIIALPFRILGWIIGKLFEAFNTAQADAEQDREFKRLESKQTPYKEERAKQIEKLKAAVPPGPVERMRATIQLNEYKTPRTKQKRIKRMIGDDSIIFVDAGTETNFTVDMILELSETERAIVSEHKLYDIVLEEVRMYTEKDILERQREYKEREDATKDEFLKQIQIDVDKTLIEGMRENTIKTKIGHLLNRPFSRDFGTPHEAKMYAEKLKTKFHPEVRALAKT